MPHFHSHVLILIIGKFQSDKVFVVYLCCLSLAFSSCSPIPLLWEQEILCKTLKFCLLSFRFYILTWKCGFKIIYSHLSPLLDPRMKLSPFQEKHNCHNFAQETKNFKSLEQLILYAIKLLIAEKMVWKLFSLVLFCRWRNLSQIFGSLGPFWT